MATYAIGDIQGCFLELTQLLKTIAFDESRDTLWFCGDLVNRGPQSLETLRFIRNLNPKHIVVLGNHDLHLLARACNAHPGFADDTLDDILQAPDKADLISWLQQKPLLHYDTNSHFAIAHAGMPPIWSITDALARSLEVHTVLQSSRANDFFHAMYGDQPNTWRDELTGWDRIRCITNYFTRMRFCGPQGQLQLTKKTSPRSAENDLVPWFTLNLNKSADIKILFGHWAALGGDFRIHFWRW